MFNEILSATMDKDVEVFKKGDRVRRINISTRELRRSPSAYVGRIHAEAEDGFYTVKWDDDRISYARGSVLRKSV